MKAFKKIFLSFNEKLVDALQKEARSGKYGMEINGGLYKAISAINAAPNEAISFQIAIGIYNWTLSWVTESGNGSKVGFTSPNKEVYNFIMQQYESINGEHDEDWSHYLQSLGAKGIFATPSKFVGNGSCYSETNLPHLQKILVKHLSNIFATDLFDNNFINGNNNNNNNDDDNDDIGNDNAGNDNSPAAP